MSNGAYGVHLQLRQALENYIKSQYFGKSPLLLSALNNKLDLEGVLYREPFIESSPAYKTQKNGIQNSKLPEWLKNYFKALSDANLGVYSSPFSHQISALEAAYQGKDLFIATGTGSGKTECFMWPIMAKLADEARNNQNSWQLRGVRTLIMYPMNALVADQLSRLRRLLGDSGHNFINIFRDTCGTNIRRPQFGMYTGRTPYPGSEPRSKEDKALANTYKNIIHPNNEAEAKFLDKLISDGKLPAKKDFDKFIENLNLDKHIPDEEDAELVTRFEMQQFCPDILITNYSMLEYMLLRPRENKIWDDTKAWLENDINNKLLFVIDEAHMYRGSSGGEVSLLLRRLFHRLGIDRNRVQFILTTASMPNQNDKDIEAVRKFANELTVSDNLHEFYYLTGEQENIQPQNIFDIPFSKFTQIKIESFEGNEQERLMALNKFWNNIDGAPEEFNSITDAYYWLYHHLTEYSCFNKMFKLCRGTAVSLKELAKALFKNENLEAALHAVSIMLSIAPLARNNNGNVLFPARMHMLFRGIKGIYACTNPNCPHSHTAENLTLGDIFLTDENFTCPSCGSTVYELFNDRRCGSLFFRGFVLKKDFENRKRTYLWHQSGMVTDDEVEEIHLFIPSDTYKLPKKQGNNKIQPCYLDIQSGFIDFQDDSLESKDGIRKLYYMDFTAKGRPNIITFSTCPHCQHELSKMQLTSFSTRGNQSFFNLIKAQFQSQPANPDKIGKLDLYPNEGRKVLVFSDSRQRAAKLARDMSEASDMTASRQIAALAINKMEQEPKEYSLDDLYDFFAMTAYEKHAPIFHNCGLEEQQSDLLKHGAQALKNYQRAKKNNRDYNPQYKLNKAINQMKEQLLRFYCSGYNTLFDSAISWLEPTEEALSDALYDLEDEGIKVSEKDFLEIFNAWVMTLCDKYVILGDTISDTIREKVRPNYIGYGISENTNLPANICEIMGWNNNKSLAAIWNNILIQRFMNKNNENYKYYIDLSRIKPKFNPNHQWYKCDKCSELTPYLLKGKCPICKCEKTHPLTKNEIDALSFWQQPISEALKGEPIRIIDTEEHTAQLSYKDQRDELWSKTEQYELRFQDFLKTNETPVDILSSTTTMEVGIDIGSLIAVGLRNIPPMRENYQQRAGRAGRRGSSLSTIVTFCEDGPHDSLYFSNPIPMFRGDPRRPWIDIHSEKIIQRHLNMIVLQSYLKQENLSLDVLPAIEFLDEHIIKFDSFLNSFEIKTNSILIPQNSKNILLNYKQSLKTELDLLNKKRNEHPELFSIDDNSNYAPKTLLDALYEEGIIPTYSFPKNVVSTYISDSNGKIKYRVERGLDIAIGEYAPGRSIVIDKTTYQIGGLYYPGTEKRNSSPAKKFIEDANYKKKILSCSECGWFGLESDSYKECPFCGNKTLSYMLPMLRPWGFAPKNAKSIEEAQLNEEFSAIQQPLYSTLPEAEDVSEINNCSNIRLAIRPNQRIIMLNKGANDKGFTICCDCGAIMPGADPSVLKNITKPYNLNFNNKACKHNHTENINLGYDFITDMLVLEFSLDKMLINLDIKGNSWLNRASQSLAEALRLAACQELDIEFTELVTGYRIRNNQKGNFLDIYIYDSLSSGAGYAVSIKNNIDSLFLKVRELLTNCTCENACHKCLKHYRNQHIHGLLDRKAALQLLDWGEKGIKAPAFSLDQQLHLLKPLKNILLQAGIQLDICGNSIYANINSKKKELKIIPGMWKTFNSAQEIFISDMQLKYAKPYALKQIIDNL